MPPKPSRPIDNEDIHDAVKDKTYNVKFKDNKIVFRQGRQDIIIFKTF